MSLPRINVPKRLVDLPSQTIDCGSGVTFVFEADQHGWVIGGAWNHPRMSDGGPCANHVYFNVPQAPKDESRYDVFEWVPFTVAYYFSCYATTPGGPKAAMNCNNHGRIRGSTWEPC